MSTDWVAPVVTGAVGIAGVAGTFWTGRQGRESAATQAREQREYDLRVQMRAEKREAYVAFLGAIHQILVLTWDVSLVDPTPEVKARRDEAENQLILTREYVRLVGPDDVREFARLTIKHLGELIASYSDPGADPIDADWDLTHAVLASMKRDLGHELIPEDLEILKYRPPEPEGPAADPGRTDEGETAGQGDVS